MKTRKPLRLLLAGGTAFLLGSMAMLVLSESTQGAYQSPEPAGDSATPVAAAGRGRVDVDGGMIQIAAQRDGIVSAVFVKEGEEVRKGDLLARQDDRSAQAALAEARALVAETMSRAPVLKVRVSAARRERDRLAPLRRDGAEATKTYDEAQSRAEEAEAELAAHEASVRLAKARLATAELEVAQREIRAPINGRIVRVMARPGTGVSTLNVSSLFTLVPGERFIFRVDVEERLIRQVYAGQEVAITLDSDPEPITGQVLRIGEILGQRKIDPSDSQQRVDERVVEAVVLLPDADSARFLIGQRGLAKFMTPVRTGALPVRVRPVTEVRG